MNRRAFLAGFLVAAAAGPAYLAGTALRPPTVRELISTPAPAVTPAGVSPGTGETPEPELLVQEPVAVQGATNRRTLKNLPPTGLIIPAIGLNTQVIPIGAVYDARGQLIWETAPFVVGHYRNTANPGEPGNVVLSGHISSQAEGDIFRRLPQVKLGDGVTVLTKESVFLYRVVDRQVVLPSATAVMEQGADSKLTLLTCVPDGVYTHRLVVTAVPVF